VDNFVSQTPTHPRQETRSTAIDPPPEAETHAHDKQPEQQKAKGREFAIAQDSIWKKQDQEQKRFLRRSYGEDSRKPVAIHANQAIQRARSRAKAFFKAVA
jgi:hypothetical protein